MRVVVSLAPPFRGGRSQGASSAGCAVVARAAIHRHLSRWHLEDLIDDATLILTELLTNAVRHGRPPWRARMWLEGGESGQRCVRLEVHDAGAGIDLDRVRAQWRHPSGSLTDGGRGLFIVDTLASSWGNNRSGDGHTVWAELEAKPPPHAAHRASGHDQHRNEGRQKRPPKSYRK